MARLRGISSVAVSLLLMAIVLIASLSAYMIMVNRLSMLGLEASAPPESSPYSFTAMIYPAEALTGYKYFLSIDIASGYEELKRFVVLVLYNTPYGQAIVPAMGAVTTNTPGYSPPTMVISEIKPSWDASTLSPTICSNIYGSEQWHRVLEISTVSISWAPCYLVIPPGGSIHLGIYTVGTFDTMNTPIGVFVCTSERCKYQGFETSVISPLYRIPAQPPWTKDTSQCQLVTSWYGSHGPDRSFRHAGFINLVRTRGNDNIYYTIIVRQQETNGWEAVALGVLPPGSSWFWLDENGMQALPRFANIIGGIEMSAYIWWGGYANSRQDFDNFFNSNPQLFWSGFVNKIYFYEYDGCWWCSPVSPFPFDRKDLFATMTVINIEVRQGYEGLWGFAIDSDDAADVIICENRASSPAGRSLTPPPQYVEDVRGMYFEHSPVSMVFSYTDPPIRATITCSREVGGICRSEVLYPPPAFLLFMRVLPNPAPPGYLAVETRYAYNIPPYAPQARGGDVETSGFQPNMPMNYVSATGMKILEAMGYPYAALLYNYRGGWDLDMGLYNKTNYQFYSFVYTRDSLYSFGSLSLRSIWGYKTNWINDYPSPYAVETKYWEPNEYTMPDISRGASNPYRISLDQGIMDGVASFPNRDPKAPVLIASIGTDVNVGGQAGHRICQPYPGNYVPPRCDTIQSAFVIPDYSDPQTLQGRRIKPLITIQGSTGDFPMEKTSVNTWAEHPRWRGIGYMIEATHDVKGAYKGIFKYFVSTTIPVIIANIPGKGEKALYGATTILAGVNVKWQDIRAIGGSIYKWEKIIPWYENLHYFDSVDLNDPTQNNDPPIGAPRSGYFTLYWDSYMVNPRAPKFLVFGDSSRPIESIEMKVVYAPAVTGFNGYYCRLDQKFWIFPPLPNPNRSSCYNLLNQVVYDWRQVMFSFENVPEDVRRSNEFINNYIMMRSRDPYTGMKLLTLPSPAFAVALIPVK
ncbi:MAG: hypothetical protein QXQ96_09790 [Sulfolobales archaeon]